MERQVLPVRTAADFKAAERIIDGMALAGEPLRPLQVVFETTAVIPFDIDWGNPIDDVPLDIEIDWGGGTIRREPVQVYGKRVAISHLRLDAEGKQMIQLTVGATESIDLEDVQLVGAAPIPTNRGVRHMVGAAWFQSLGPAVQFTARNVSVLDAHGAGSVNFANGGASSFGDVTWVDGHFGGCASPEINLARVRTFSAPGTIRLGNGPYYQTLPQAVVLDDGESRPPDDALLEKWRGEWENGHKESEP